MEIARKLFSSQLESLAWRLDTARALLLRQSLKVGLLRFAYKNLAMRLSAAFFLLSALYLPVALRRPDLLLAFGPFIFGYPHLIASYRFLAKERKRLFPVFALVTVAYFVVRALMLHFRLMPVLPFGFLEISCAGLVLLLSGGKSVFCLRAFVVVALNGALLWLAWQDPLLFAGGTLILHNWVAFFYWWAAAGTRATKLSVALAALAFFSLHCAVCLGVFDVFFPPLGEGSVLMSSVGKTGWILASWTENPLIWYRAVVLYAFGLSLHYFIWLKAIPECQGSLKRPFTFRVSLEALRKDLGLGVLFWVSLLSVVGVVVWGFSFELGTRVYFGMALLHGWLELNFFVWGWIGGERKDLEKRRDQGDQGDQGDQKTPFNNSREQLIASP